MKKHKFSYEKEMLFVSFYVAHECKFVVACLLFIQQRNNQNLIYSNLKWDKMKHQRDSTCYWWLIWFVIKYKKLEITHVICDSSFFVQKACSYKEALPNCSSCMSSVILNLIVCYLLYASLLLWKLLYG